MPLFKISFLEKLKHLLKLDINISDINLVNLSINIQKNSNNECKPVVYSPESNLLTLNLENLTQEQSPALGTILKQAVADGATLLEEKSNETLRDISHSEQSDDVKSVLDFFRNIIPKDDFDALRAAMYIRTRFKDGCDSKSIYDLKGGVIKKYGKRGLKICNLCSAGYFENLLKPLYEDMRKYQDFSIEKFISHYNLIISEEAFAVFISRDMPGNEVKYIIEEQIKRNFKYGVKKVDIHGIGRDNSKKIRDAIYDIEIAYPKMNKRIGEEGRIIFATLSFE